MLGSKKKSYAAKQIIFSHIGMEDLSFTEKLFSSQFIAEHGFSSCLHPVICEENKQ
jgi:hypothetical protein